MIKASYAIAMLLQERDRILTSGDMSHENCEKLNDLDMCADVLFKFMRNEKPFGDK